MANPNKIGALWIDERYGSLTGTIELNGQKVNVICFRNKEKKNEKSPDYDVLIKRPKGEGQAQAETDVPW